MEVKYVPECELGKDGEKSVNTEATCFLCLFNYNYNNEHVFPLDGNGGKVSLFRICRYLKIDCHNSIRVSLCPECKTVVEKLANLLEQLELFQMKVDYTLEKFARILRNFQEPDNSKSFRVHIINKCDKKLFATVPKVVIADIPSNQTPFITPGQDNLTLSPPSPSPSSPESETSILSKPSGKWKCSSCPRSYIHKPNLFRHRRNCPSLNRSLAPPNNPKIPKVDVCSLCKRTITFPNYQRHKIIHHFESFFTSHKLPHLTPEDFKVYCEHAFKLELLSSRKKVTSGGQSICQCPHCPHPFTKLHSLRQHLLTNHKQIIVKKLAELQNSSTVAQIKEINLPRFSFSSDNQRKSLEEKNSDPNYYTCDLCQPKVTVHIYSKIRHLSQFHATTIFSASKIKDNMDENDFRLYCEHLFDNEIKSFGRIIDEKNNKKIECSHCQKLFGEESIVRNHLIREHEQIMAEKLVKLQETVDVAEIREKFKKIEVEREKKTDKRSRGKKLLTEVNCEFCGKAFGFRFNLRRHLVKVHKLARNEAEVAVMKTKKQNEDNSDSGSEFDGKVEGSQESSSDSSASPTLRKPNWDKWRCDDCPRSFLLKRTLSAHRRKEHGENIDYICPMCPSKFTNRSAYLQHKNFECSHLPPGTSKSNPPPGFKSCTICNQIVAKIRWERHQILCHVETVFKTCQEPDLTQENFKIYCEHVFNMLHKSAKASRNSDNIIVRKCPYCPDRFRNQSILRVHLVNHHKNILTKIVIATQKELTLEQVKNGKALPKISISKEDLKEPKGPDKTPRKQYTCRLCKPKRKMTDSEKPAHIARCHPETIFSAAKNPNVSTTDFKLYCHDLLAEEIKNCKRLTNDEDVNKSKIKCEHCPKAFCSIPATRSHLARVHKEILKEKLIKLQMTKGPSNKSSDKKQIYEPVGRKCKECGRVLHNECGLRRHMRLVHKIEPDKVDKEVAGKRNGDENHIVEKMEVVEEDFEQSALFVTKVDPLSFRQSGVNYVEMAEGNTEFNCDEEEYDENEVEDFEMEIVPDKDPLEI